MALKTLFPRQKELVNYDYFDIAEGVGYQVYFGFKGDAAENLVSTSNNIYSESVGSFLKDNSVGTTFTKKFDLDFDIKFNIPKNIKGLIYANIPIGVAATDVTDKDFEFYAIVQARHFDGSTETDIATSQSRTQVATDLKTDGPSFISMIAVCKIDITSIQHFKKDETLRLTVEGWFRTTEASAKTCHIMICHDPKNRNFKAGTLGELEQETEIELGNEPVAGGTITYQNTQMIFHVPFRLDI